MRRELARDDLGDDDLDELEREADDRYAEMIDSDAVIIERFERRLAAAPEDFAPV